MPPRPALRSHVLTAPLVVGLALAGAACDETTDDVLLILQNKAPTEQCEFLADEGGLFIPDGVLDAEQTSAGYVFTPLVRNAAAPSAEFPNANVAILEGAESEVVAGPATGSAAAVAALGANTLRTHATSGSVDPGGGLTVALFPILDPDQVAAIADLLGPGGQVQVIVRSRLFGRLNDDEVASRRFDYPVTICRGCVAQAACFPGQQ